MPRGAENVKDDQSEAHGQGRPSRIWHQKITRPSVIRLEVYGFSLILWTVDLIEIYQCLCDRTRLRVLNLLCHGPLCVCHFQELLNESQVKVSKHLSYLRSHAMVEATREANWMVYRLPAKPSPELKANLACLQDCTREQPVFRRDLEKTAQASRKVREIQPDLLPSLPKRKAQTACSPRACDASS